MKSEYVRFSLLWVFLSDIVVLMVRFQGQLLAVVIAFCWAQNSLIYSYLGKKADAQSTAHIRLWIALPMILLTHKLFLGTFLPADPSTEELLFLGISGIIGFFAADLLIFQAYIDLGPRETLVILSTSPIITTAISFVLMDEQMTMMQLVGICITVAGVMVVVFSSSARKTLGDEHWIRGILCAGGGSILQAAAVVLAKAGMQQGIHPISGNLIRLGFGFAALVGYALLKRRFLHDFMMMRSGRNLALLGSAAFAGPVLGIVLTLQAITLAPAGVITAISQISPILLLPIERFVLKHRLNLLTAAGTVLAIAGAGILVVS